jgi:phosphate uptake regulator
VSLLASLEKIADLAASICRAVIGLASEARIRDLPSIRRLAELVPDMLRDALGAVRTNDHSSAKRVLGVGFTVDTCFAQSHLDVLQVVPQGARDLHVARQFHALGRALEQIGDSASEIAASVRNPAVGLPA